MIRGSGVGTFLFTDSQNLKLGQVGKDHSGPFILSNLLLKQNHPGAHYKGLHPDRKHAKCIILVSADMDEESEVVKASLACPMNPEFIKRGPPKRVTHLLAR